MPVGYAISGDLQLPRIRDPGILVFGGLHGILGNLQVHFEGLVSSLAHCVLAHSIGRYA